MQAERNGGKTAVGGIMTPRLRAIAAVVGLLWASIVVGAAEAEAPEVSVETDGRFVAADATAARRAEFMRRYEAMIADDANGAMLERQGNWGDGVPPTPMATGDSVDLKHEQPDDGGVDDGAAEEPGDDEEAPNDSEEKDAATERILRIKRMEANARKAVEDGRAFVKARRATARATRKRVHAELDTQRARVAAKARNVRDRAVAAQKAAQEAAARKREKFEASRKVRRG